MHTKSGACMSGNNIYAWMKIEEKYVVVLADLYYNKYKI